MKVLLPSSDTKKQHPNSSHETLDSQLLEEAYTLINDVIIDLELGLVFHCKMVSLTSAPGPPTE